MTKTEQTRLWTWRCQGGAAGWRASRNIARTCRHFGISRQAFYKWKRRFDEFGAAGLWDRPRAPHRSPRATRRRWSARFCICGRHYHFGPGRIAEYLTGATSPERKALDRGHRWRRAFTSKRH